MSAGLRHRRLWQLVGGALVLAVIGLTLTPSPPANLTAIVDWGDKAAHGLAYAMLMGWYAQLYHTLRPRAAIATALIVMGVVLELIQGQMAARYFELGDAVANASGVLLAWVVARGPLARVLAGVDARL